MKKIIFTLTMMAGIFTLQAMVPNDMVIQEKIRNQIVYPDNAKDNYEQGFVLVCFTVDTTGRVVVRQVNSNNPILKQYVVDTINQLVIDEGKKYEGEYNIRIDFRLL